MKLFVGVTNNDWYRFLSERAPDEVNFWRPRSQTDFKRQRDPLGQAPPDGSGPRELPSSAASVLHRAADYTATES
jgi:hypothetical protein